MNGICKMDEDTKTWMYDFLMPHIGHKIVCVPYGDPENPDDICIECETCISFGKITNRFRGQNHNFCSLRNADQGKMPLE